MIVIVFRRLRAFKILKVEIYHEPRLIDTNLKGLFKTNITSCF